MDEAAKRELSMRTAVVLADLMLVRKFARAGIKTLLATSEADDVRLYSRHAAARLILAPWTPPTERYALEGLCRAARALTRQHGAKPVLAHRSEVAAAFVTRNLCRLEAHFDVAAVPHDVIASRGDEGLFAWDDPLPAAVGLGRELRRAWRVRQAWA
jgi:hypothetical protein